MFLRGEKEMMDNSLLVKIQAMHDSFSKAEKKVSSYIIEQPEKVIRYSVTELADNAGVSEATIIRVCRKLGLAGYQDLKVTLAQSIISPLQAINESIQEDDDYKEIIRKVFNTIIEALNYTLNVLDYDALKAAADLIYQAKKVVVIGVGNSAAIAMDLCHKLLRLGCNVISSSDSHIQVIISCCCNEGNVMVAISHSGSSKDIVEAAKLWKNGGGKLITITNIGRSPLNKLADISLVTASRETKYKFSALPSRACQIAIIDAIYTLITLAHKEDIIKRFMQIDKCLREKKY